MSSKVESKENKLEEKKQENKEESKPNTTVTFSHEMRQLLREVSDSERESAIIAILQALKINPLEILQLNTTFDENDIKKQYRKLSLLVHPDRCPNHLKENATKAFNLLSSAKQSLESKEYCSKLKQHCNEAKRRIIEKHMIEKAKNFVFNSPPNKKQKLNDNKNNNDYNNNDNINNAELEECEIKKELREILIDEAWKKRIESNAVQKLEQQTLARREELKKIIAAEKERKKEWDNGREQRVNSWRDFQKKKKKKKKRKFNQI